VDSTLFRLLRLDEETWLVFGSNGRYEMPVKDVGEEDGKRTGMAKPS